MENYEQEQDLLNQENKIPYFRENRITFLYRNFGKISLGITLFLLFIFNIAILNGMSKLGSSAKTEMGNVNQKVDMFMVDFNGIESQINDFQTQFNTIQNQINNFQTQFDNIQMEVNELTKEFTKMDQKADVVYQQIVSVYNQALSIYQQAGNYTEKLKEEYNLYKTPITEYINKNKIVMDYLCQMYKIC